MIRRFNALFGHQYRAEDGDAAGGGASSGEDAGFTASPSDVNWGEMADIADSTPASAEPTPVAEPIAPAPAEPAAPAVAEPVVAPVAQPVVAPPQPVAQPEPAVPQMSNDEMRAKFSQELQQYYKFDEATAMQLHTEPELVLPQLAANLHMNVMDAVMATLPQRVMQMIQQHTESARVESEAENTFFTAWPELRDQKAAVLQVGKMFRAANPNAPADEAVKKIGEIVMASLGRTRAVVQQQTPPPPTQQPFVPASGSGAGAPPQQQSVWDAMIQPD